MSLKSLTFAFAVFATVSSVQAQAWKDAYDKALGAARNQDWGAARASFLEAVASRPEDQSGPTVMPGPVTEPVRWRGGSPYSPNFGAAYASMKLAQTLPETERNPHFEAAVTGFETLIAKGQTSPATVYFLNEVYGTLGKPDKQRELGAKVQGGITWKVDSSFMTPEDAGIVGSAVSGSNDPTTTVVSGGTGVGPKTILVDAGNRTGVPVTAIAGIVPVLPNKFALIIGNSETQMGSGAVPFASSDAMLVRDALVQNAGYGDTNVDLVVNGTADQIRKSAQALAERMPMDGTLLIYFSGIGVNVDGKDYYAGIDAALTSDTSKMVGIEELLTFFRGKGARVFAFHQSNRAMTDGRYFGRESPIFGLYAFCQATTPGEQVYGTVSGGKLVGLYTKAFVDVLAEFRSNKVPITEFAWTIFQTMQGGSPLQQGLGLKQVPSLPVIYNMASDSRF